MTSFETHLSAQERKNLVDPIMIPLNLGFPKTGLKSICTPHATGEIKQTRKSRVIMMAQKDSIYQRAIMLMLHSKFQNDLWMSTNVFFGIFHSIIMKEKAVSHNSVTFN